MYIYIMPVLVHYWYYEHVLRMDVFGCASLYVIAGDIEMMRLVSNIERQQQRNAPPIATPTRSDSREQPFLTQNEILKRIQTAYSHKLPTPTINVDVRTDNVNAIHSAVYTYCTCTCTCTSLLNTAVFGLIPRPLQSSYNIACIVNNLEVA